MQDRYAGDVGDFGKYSLLRSLFTFPEYTLGVIWYKYPDEIHNNDGGHIDYLQNPQYRKCDPELIECLSHVVSGERSIAHLERQNILPEPTVYYSSILDFHVRFPSQTKAHKTARANERTVWLNNAVKSASACDVVFLDPDNGLEIPSIPNIHQIKSGKYVYYSEVASLFNNNKACVIYHHLGMRDTHEFQIRYRARHLKEMVPGIGTVFAIRYRPYSPRAYFICSTRKHSGTIRNKLKDYLNSACSFGWDTYYEV